MTGEDIRIQTRHLHESKPIDEADLQNEIGDKTQLENEMSDKNTVTNSDIHTESTDKKGSTEQKGVEKAPNTCTEDRSKNFIFYKLSKF